MKSLFGKIVWTFIFISVACEQLKERLREAEEGATEGCSSITRNCETKTWFMGTQSSTKTNWTAAAKRDQKSLKVLKILQKVLSHNHKVTTVALFGANEAISLKDIFAENHVPLLIVKDKANWHIGSRFNSHFLSIVLLPSNHALTDPLFKSLQRTLKGFHLKIIIIIKEFLAVEEDNQLLNWFHSNGFWKILLMDFEGNTLALQRFADADKMLQQLTLEEFMRSGIAWHNLQGAAITCSLAVNPPRAFIEYDKQKNFILKGFFGSIISLFALHYNATLKPFVIAVYTEMDCVKYVSSEKVDICVDAVPYDEQYLVTYPEELVNSYLIVPHDKPLAMFYYFLKPFQQNVWFVVTLSFFYKIITLSFIHRMQHGSWNSSLQMLYAVVSVLYLPFRLTRIKQPYRRFLELIMIFVGFVVANWYLSVLSSLLFTRLYSPGINSVQNLRDHNISIMVDEFEFYLLNSSAIDPIIRQQLQSVPNDILLQHRRDLDPHYAYYSTYDKIDFYLHQQKFLQRPRMKVLPKPVNIILGGIPMRPNWPFQHLLDDFYRRLLESGIYNRIYVESLDQGIYSGYLQYFATEHRNVEPLTTEYFQMPAMLLAVGFLVAFMAFLVELFVFKICYRKCNRVISQFINASDR